MKVLSKESHNKLKSVLSILIPAILLVAVFLIPRFMGERASEFYSRFIFPVVSLPGNIFSGLFHFSVTENVIVVGSVIGAGLFILFVFMVIKKALVSGGAIRFTVRVISVVLIIALVMSAVFQLMHGINYRRTPVVEKLDLVESDRSIEQYKEALYWAYLGMVSARSQMGQDQYGVSHLSSGFEELTGHANYLVDNFSAQYDLGMSTNFVRAKPVALSIYWSLTDIVGVYDPFLGEANINTGYIDAKSFPLTVCHELCHTKGYASETDCNIIAALACIGSSRADFRYAGYYFIFMDLYTVVYNDALCNGGEVPGYLKSSNMVPVLRDMQASSNYWKKIHNMFMSEEISVISESANDAFLKSNGQEGTVTYKVPDNVFLDFYLTYVQEADIM